MLTISKEEVRQSCLIDLLNQKHSIKEKIRLFEHEFQKSFADFEKDVTSNREDFHKWDSYIEWKGFIPALKDVEDKIEEINRGNFTIA